MVAMEVRAEQVQQATDDLQFHEWTLSDGRLWAQFHRTADGFLVRFPHFADYQLDATANVVRCLPVPGASSETIWHLFHNQVLPLALSHQGNLVFHASAVQIAEGAVAFLGESGKGKSTLAASFASNGFPFLTDDGLLVRPSSEGGWRATPSQPSIRLWEDSQHALVGADAPAAPALEFTSKGRFLSSDVLVHRDQPCRLKCIYVLGDGSATEPTIETLTPSNALIELVKHSFLLDIDERAMLASHFDELATLVEQVPCVRFDYPRAFDRLGQVRACVAAHLKQEC